MTEKHEDQIMANAQMNDQIVANLQMNESKKFYDRANFFIAAEAFLFQAFVAAIIGHSNLGGYLVWIPVVIFAIAISLDLVYFLSSYVQIRTRLQPLSNSFEKIYNRVAEGYGLVLQEPYRSEFSATPQTDASKGLLQWLSRLNLKDLVYKWVPVILFVGWVIMLFLYYMQWP